MNISHGKIVLKDVSLREGSDVPNVNYSSEQKLKIVKLLDKANTPEIEIVAPSAVSKDLEFVKGLKEENLRIKTSGLIYSYRSSCQDEIEEAVGNLDRYDLLMPVSPKRKPFSTRAKVDILMDTLVYSLRYCSDVGVGFPHSMQTEVEFLLEIAKESAKNGAKRVTIYDTNGGANPFVVYDLVKEIKKNTEIPLFFHGHNDLGLATANSLAAVYAGADGLDVSINGMGDRAGNASFEQLVLCLHLNGFDAGIVLQDLRFLSKTIEEESDVNTSALAPIIGKYAFCHKSPSHLENPELFEAFDPKLIGADRMLSKE
jgi:isopropylmalate/homocitrate/citramalate synthase